MADSQDRTENTTRPQGQESSNASQPPTEEVDLEQQDEFNVDMKKSPTYIIWSLLTFLRRAAIYLTLRTLSELNLFYFPTWAQVIFKCLPIVSLMVFIFRRFNSFKLLVKNTYALLIMIGLLFSIGGDACLVFGPPSEALFVAGAVCFIVAHFLYVFAFGWKPFKSRYLFRSLLTAALLYYYLYIPSPNGTRVAVGQRGILLKIGVAFYVIALLGMQWRAWARVTFYDLRQNRWFEVMGAIGSTFFFVSDTIIFLDNFKFLIVGAHLGVMVTYYIAQMFIALSVVDGKSIEWPQERAKLARERECFLNPKDWLAKGPKCIANWIFS